jgi:hypothetical protein
MPNKTLQRTRKDRAAELKRYADEKMSKQLKQLRVLALAAGCVIIVLSALLGGCSCEDDKDDNISKEKRAWLCFYDAEATYRQSLQRAGTEQKKWDLTVEYNRAGWLTYDLLNQWREHPRSAAAQIAKWPLQRRLVYFLQQPDRVGNILWSCYPEVVSRLNWTVQDLEDIGSNIDSEWGDWWGSEYLVDDSQALLTEGASEWSQGELAQKLLTRLVNQNFKTRKQFEEWFSINRDNLAWDPATKMFVIQTPEKKSQ